MTDEVAARTYVAFVRAVMIGREGLHRPVLLEMFERAGATDPVSYISTGNVSFDVEPDRLDDVVATVESELERLLGRATPLFVRSLDQLRSLLARDPFADAPFDEVYARLVTFLRPEVPSPLELPMTAPNGDWSVFAATASEVFSVTRAWPDRQPQDPGGVIQRAAGQPVTTRALGTIERLVAKLDDRAGDD
ncbi:MAG: DUF1697 domain-containing protein [Ilumatobacteraceae bacterium]|nr:DUF1697 domain-containing protein [Ilumatobacteraceae bacterium]